MIPEPDKYEAALTRAKDEIELVLHYGILMPSEHEGLLRAHMEIQKARTRMGCERIERGEKCPEAESLS
jgi:hypothetical protein